jgi:hypothetical protein
LTRIRAYSERVSLSAAQLALAREYGFGSWPALHAEVERRLAELLPRQEETGPAARWSFGGATAIETAAGMLYPGTLVAGRGYAALDASLMPFAQTRDRLSPPPFDESAREAWRAVALDAIHAFEAVAVTDDQGMTYAIRGAGMSAQDSGLISLQAAVDPVPARERGWLELRGQDGSVARLSASAHQEARVSRLAPAPDSPAARELSQRALDLIALQLDGAGRNGVELEQQCSAALARAAEIQRAGGPGAVGDLPGQLARLGAFLTGHGPADGLARGWLSIINAVDATDGPAHHLDIAAVLPPLDNIALRVDSLVSEARVWKLYLTAEPGWWTYTADRQQMRAHMYVHAEDDLGGLYLSQGDGSSARGDHEELTFRFLPRLNPLARTLTLAFGRAAEQVTIEVRLP